MSKKAEVMTKLLREVKQNKSDEYRSGYVDGVLDAANEFHPNEQQKEMLKENGY